MHERFKKLNLNKPYHGQIKPFNFALVGIAMQKQSLRKDSKHIKPLASYRSDPQEAVYEPFVDYETREIREGPEHWLPLSETILKYLDHPEATLDGDEGWLERKHIHVTEVTYIGKEAKEVVVGDGFYTHYKKPVEYEKLARMTLSEAQKTFHIPKSTFYKWKKRWKIGGKPRFYAKTRKKLS